MEISKIIPEEAHDKLKLLEPSEVLVHYLRDVLTKVDGSSDLQSQEDKTTSYTKNNHDGHSNLLGIVDPIEPEDGIEVKVLNGHKRDFIVNDEIDDSDDGGQQK